MATKIENPFDELGSIDRLSKDLKRASETMGPKDARYAVDAYYAIQDERKAAQLRVFQADNHGEPHDLNDWIIDNMKVLERRIASALDRYSMGQPIGQWARSVVGIGPVIGAGLIAYIDVTIQPSASHLWSYAGLNPQAKWEKGQKRPWNAHLKVLCWKIGMSFEKTQNNPNSFYGPLLQQRKQREIDRNEAGLFKDQAIDILRSKNIGKETEAYKWYSSGKLPPAHIRQRALRWTTKLFLAHYWEQNRRILGLEVPKPYPIQYLGHVDRIEPPA